MSNSDDPPINSSDRINPKNLSQTASSVSGNQVNLINHSQNDLTPLLTNDDPPIEDPIAAQSQPNVLNIDLVSSCIT